MNVIDEIHKICRACLTSIGNMTPVFDNVDLWDVNVAEMLRECGAVEVTKTDRLPKLICPRCVDKLNASYQFRQRCKTSEQILLDLLGDTNKKTRNEDGDQIVEHSLESVYSDNDSTDFGDSVLKDEKQIPQNSNLDVKTEPSVQSDINDLQHVSSNTDLCCIDCNLVFKTKYASYEHRRRKHTEQNYVCELCDKIFIAKWAWESHLLTHGYNCTKCFKNFDNQADLDVHKGEHKDDENFICKECGKVFISRFRLARHFRMHTGERPHLCTVCGKAFALKENLSTHSRIHTGVKPYSCEICNNRYTQWASLRNHLLTHANNRIFNCPQCDKSFLRKYVLRNHMRLHSDDRNYPCTICSKRFKTPNDLRGHGVMHSGEPKYKCLECGKCFIRNRALKCHQRIHTGERPYKCSICERSFTQAHVLRSHMKTHEAKTTLVSTS